MSYPLDDTIAAVASPPGGAARGILRLSGPQVRECLKHVFRPEAAVDWTAASSPTAIPGSLALEGIAPRLPCEVYFWPTGQSYTGQPVIEVHALGSPPLLEAALGTLCAAGARLAQPGEFTLRAFLAGRLDLTRAEAVLGVIDAAGPRDLDVALAQLAGGLASPLGELRDKLVDLLAHLEAGFDFADEDLPFVTASELDAQLADAADRVRRLVRQMRSRADSAEPMRAVLVGWPNTGKSSLFNALAGATALVSDAPGTTRDYLTARLDLDGVGCLLVDTAGVDSTVPAGEAVRQAAQEASRQQTSQARLRLLCLDVSRTPNAWERARLDEHTDWLIVLTKADLPRQMELDRPAVVTSRHTGQGIDALRRRLREAVLAAGAPGEVVAGTAVRCRDSLRLAAESLERARQLQRDVTGEELVAAEVRLAIEELGKVVGAVYTEDVLDRIFSRFCIGK